MKLLPLCLVTLMAAVHAAPKRSQQSVAYARDAKEMLLRELNSLKIKSLLGKSQKKSLTTANAETGLNEDLKNFNLKYRLEEVKKPLSTADFEAVLRGVENTDLNKVVGIVKDLDLKNLNLKSRLEEVQKSLSTADFETALREIISRLEALAAALMDADPTDSPDPTENPDHTDCPAPRFWCEYTKRCIHGSFVCDGDNDCGDMADEQECDKDCPAPSFWCEYTKRCIDGSWVCDGDNDCGDMSDEQECEKAVCPDTYCDTFCQFGYTKAEGSDCHTCVCNTAQANNATSAGQRCNSQMRCFAPCPTGYKLKNGCPTCDCAPENKINECEENPCGQHASCVNTPGSFVCFCDEPFQMIDGECTDPKLAPIDAPGCGLRPLVPNNGAGELDVRKRIVGGDISIPNSWPAMCYLMSIQSGRFQPCGGNLVKNKLGVFYLITAAHCVEQMPFSQYYVFCGLHNTHDMIRRAPLRVSNITKHPKYIHVLNHSVEYDIAICEFVDQPIESDSIKAVCLPNEKHTGGEPAIAVGWGRTVDGERGSRSNELKQVNNVIMSDEVCEEELDQQGPWSFNKSSMICAAEKTGLGGVCHGDSGGPLYTYTDGRWTLTGVSSFAKDGCANKDYPDGFNDVFDMRDWIDQQIN